MDDPSLIQNSTSVSSDIKDNMASVSPSKRTIVLGVVNTSGMKSSNLNRKRRWDQPPDDISETPVVKKLCLSENETFPVDELESPETVSTVTPSVDRFNFPCEYTPDKSHQSDFVNSTDSEETFKELHESQSEHISSEASAMTIDLPEDNSDRLSSPPHEHSSEVMLCSVPNENLSEVSTVEMCERLQCNENVNSHDTDSCFVVNNDASTVESCDTHSESKPTKPDQKSNIAATIISHQSDELRRIMFSYDEGTSDSDSMDSSDNKKDAKSEMSHSNNKTSEIGSINNISESGLSLNNDLMPTTDIEIPNTGLLSDAVALKGGPEKSDNCITSIVDIKTPTIQPEIYTSEKDAFIESRKPLENLGVIGNSSIESQHNIPDKTDFGGVTNDLKETELCNNYERSDIDIQNSLQPPEIYCEEGMKILESNVISDEIIKINQNVEPTNEDLSVSGSEQKKVIHKEMGTEVTGAPYNVSNHPACLQGNQISLHIPNESLEKNKTDPNVGTQDEDISTKAVLNQVDTNQEVQCDTGQLLENSPASSNSEESTLENKNIHGSSDDKFDAVSDKTTETNGKSNTPSNSVAINLLSETHSSVDNNEILPTSGFKRFQDTDCSNGSPKKVGSSLDIQVSSMSSTEVTSDSQEIVKDIYNIPMPVNDLIISSKTGNLNLDKSKPSSNLNVKDSEESSGNDKEKLISSPHNSCNIVTSVSSDVNISPVPLSSIDVIANVSEEFRVSNLAIENEIIRKEENLEDINSVCDLAEDAISNYNKDSDLSLNEKSVLYTENLDKEGEGSLKVAPSSIDPAVIEVIFGSNKQTCAVETETGKCTISHNIETTDLKKDMVESELKIDITNINQEKIAAELLKSPSGKNKTLSDNSEVQITDNINQNTKAEINVNAIESVEENMVIDDNIEKIVCGTIDLVTKAEDKGEVGRELNICPDIDTDTEIDCEMKGSTTDQNIGIAIAEVEFGIIKNSDSAADSSSNISSSLTDSIIKMTRVNNARNEIINTERELSSDKSYEMDVSTEVPDVTSVIKKDLKTRLSNIKTTKFEISSMDVDVENVVRSEGIETEISIEENVESELCSFENNQVNMVEAELNSTSIGEHSINAGGDTEVSRGSVENTGNDVIIESIENVIDTVETTEIVLSTESNNESNEEVETESSSKEIVETECKEVIEIESNEVVEIEINKLIETESNLDITKYNELPEASKDVLIQEEIIIENSTVDDGIYDGSSITVSEDVIEITSVDSTLEHEELNASPEDYKDFVETIDDPETVITDETTVDINSILENEILIEDETKSMTRVMNESGKIASPAKVASEISFVDKNVLQDDSKTLTEDIESFVVEEVVTCDTPESNKDVDNDLDDGNDDISSTSVGLEEICETTEPLAINNQPSAVITEKTVDSVESTNNNQNLVFIESNLDFKKDNELHVETIKKLKEYTEDLKKEPLLNSIRPSAAPPVEMECETTVNSISKTVPSFTVEPMEVDDVPSVSSRPDISIKTDTTKLPISPASVINSDIELPCAVKAITTNIPLLKTVTNSMLLRKEKPLTLVGEKNESGNITRPDPKLEPITLRIYKDNLTVKTDDLDSPKKNKSPKLSSELKSQLSPHTKSSENRSSISPTTKKLEFTLKIAKDVNTNIPRATMSPKNHISPSGIHKSGDILRAELTSESGRSSPAYISPECLANKVKIKIPKTSPSGLSKEYGSHAPGSSIAEEINKIKEEIIDQSAGISLPKTPIEIGHVFKKMMESDKSVDSKSVISMMDLSLNSSNPLTPLTVTPVVKKRGRPRKIINTVLTTGENDARLNSSPMPSSTTPNPFNHSQSASPGLDMSSGMDISDQLSNRQVRSCRARTKPIVVKTRRPRGGAAARGGGAGRVSGATRGGGMRGRGSASSVVISGIARAIAAEKDPEKLAEKLSEREKAELAKIEERKQRQRLERIAKNEAKKAKKLAKKLKDEERKQRRLREKAEALEAAAPQVFEEETRMSAPDGSSRGHTPAPGSSLSRLNQNSEQNEESQNSISTPTSSQIKRGRMEIPIDLECKEVRVDQLAEYQWQGSELFMIQEQVSMYLGVKSFKRKYPDLKRRSVEAEERTFLEDSGLVPKSMCDLGLTAVSSAEVLDIMYLDFPEKYEEFRRYVREKQAKEAAFKQKTVFANLRQDKSKGPGEPRDQALEAVAMWNSNLNRERREDRRCALDLQTFTVHYPKQVRDKMSRPLPKTGMYPVSLLPGQFSDHYKVYTPTELMYFPLNTVMYGPLKPNERQPINPSDGSGSDSSSSSTSDDSSSSDSGDDTEDENGVSRECKICNGEKKTNKESHPEILLQCSNCKGLCHPTCQEITPEMLPHIKKYTWHCSNCKKCMQCKNSTKDIKMLFCDLCDRGYHINCVGLRKAPEGRWHCSVCSFCTACGSKDPGGQDWNYEYKKTDKGVRLYQRTLCVPCSKILQETIEAALYLEHWDHKTQYFDRASQAFNRKFVNNS